MKQLFTFSFLLLSLLSLLGSCKTDETITIEPIPDADLVIRVKNATTKNLRSVKVENLNFGELKTGEKSNYQAALYDLCEMPFTQFEFGGQDYYNGAFCGTGLTYHEKGKFTLKITEINESNKTFSYNLVRN